MLNRASHLAFLLFPPPFFSKFVFPDRLVKNFHRIHEFFKKKIFELLTIGVYLTLATRSISDRLGYFLIFEIIFLNNRFDGFTTINNRSICVYKKDREIFF